MTNKDSIVVYCDSHSH